MAHPEIEALSDHAKFAFCHATCILRQKP
jgi:hypothetical protein